MFIYSVKFVCGTQNVPATGGPSPCTSVRPGVYSTEINIHNFNKTDAKIEKRLLWLVQNDDATKGREPESQAAKLLVQNFKLKSDWATMDDCCNLDRLNSAQTAFDPGKINIGFLEILSPSELSVTAVYTATDKNGASISIDVETFSAHTV